MPKGGWAWSSDAAGVVRFSSFFVMAGPFNWLKGGREKLPQYHSKMSENFVPQKTGHFIYRVDTIFCVSKCSERRFFNLFSSSVRPHLYTYLRVDIFFGSSIRSATRCELFRTSVDATASSNWSQSLRGHGGKHQRGSANHMCITVCGKYFWMFCPCRNNLCVRNKQQHATSTSGVWQAVQVTSPLLLLTLRTTKIYYFFRWKIECWFYLCSYRCTAFYIMWLFLFYILSRVSINRFTLWYASLNF
jgi:hypothetical protein